MRWEWIFISVVSFAFLSLSNSPSVNTNVHLQFFLLSFGAITWSYAFSETIVFHIKLNQEHILIILILVLAAGVRIYNLDTVYSYFVDELSFLRNTHLVESNEIKLLVPETNAFSNLYPYLQYLSKQLLGANLLSLRLPSVIFGLIGIAGVYTLSLQCFSRRTALLSAFILATLPVHIQFSRVGLNNIAGSSLAIWVFIFILKGTRDKKLYYFAVGGILLGLTHYFYEIDRIFYSLFFICWVVWLSIFNPEYRKMLRYFIFTGVTAIAVAIPVYYSLVSNDQLILQRFMHYSGIGNEIQLNFLSKYIYVMANDYFYRSDAPFVPWAFTPFFIAGFIFILTKIKSFNGSLITWIIIGISLSNGLIADELSSPSARYIPAYIFLSIVIGIGIDIGIQFLNKRYKHLSTLAFVIIMLIGFLQIQYYFTVYINMMDAKHFSRLDRNYEPYPALDDMILRAMDLPSGSILHIISDVNIPQEILIDVPIFYGRNDDLTILQISEDELSTYLETIDGNQNNIFTFSGYNSYILNDIGVFFPIKRSTGSENNISYNQEMKFYYILY